MALDYGQFYLHSVRSDLDDVLAAVDIALEGDGIAQRGGVLVVISPHQNNFEMPLLIERWSGEPPPDLDDWQVAYAAHLAVGDDGIYYETPTLDGVDIAVPAGAYRALITGRGFVGHGWPGSTKPGDVWRIQLWPSSDRIEPIRLREFPVTKNEPPKLKLAEVGAAAVTRLHHAFDHTADLSGDRTTVHTERAMPGTRRRLYRYFRAPHGWLTSSYSPGDDEFVLHRGWREDRPIDLIVADDGVIDCAIVDSRSPQRVVLTWTWKRSPLGQRSRNHPGPDRRPAGPLLPAPSATIVHFDLEPTREDSDGNPSTLVRVTHEQVPQEWAADLTTYWAWTLESCVMIYHLNEKY